MEKATSTDSTTELSKYLKWQSALLVLILFTVINILKLYEEENKLSIKTKEQNSMMAKMADITGTKLLDF